MIPLKATSVTDFISSGLYGNSFIVSIYSVEGDLLGEYDHSTGTYTHGTDLTTAKQIYLQISGVDSALAGINFFGMELSGSGIYIYLYINYAPTSGDKVYFDENLAAYSNKELTTIILGKFYSEAVSFSEAAFKAPEVIYVEPSISFTELLVQEDIVGGVDDIVLSSEDSILEPFESTFDIVDDFIEDYFEELYTSIINSLPIEEGFYVYVSGTGEFLDFKEFIEAILDNDEGIVDPIFFTEDYNAEWSTYTSQTIHFSEEYRSVYYSDWSERLSIRESTWGFIQFGKFESSIFMDKVVIYDSILAKNLPIGE